MGMCVCIGHVGGAVGHGMGGGGGGLHVWMRNGSDISAIHNTTEGSNVLPTRHRHGNWQEVSINLHQRAPNDVNETGRANGKYIYIQSDHIQVSSMVMGQEWDSRGGGGGHGIGGTGRVWGGSKGGGSCDRKRMVGVGVVAGGRGRDPGILEGCPAF